METAWQPELAKFLDDLLAVQAETLEVLTKKRTLLLAADHQGLGAMADQEASLLLRLQGCLQRREQLLACAAQDGLPSENLGALTSALPRKDRDALNPTMQLAAARTRLLRHQGLTNWVIVQRTLLHLSQLLEIIATGGRLQPTYGKGEKAASSGNLLDWAA